MAQLAMLPLVLLLASHTMADIMVQPGYGRSTSESHSTKQPIMQSSENDEQSKTEEDPGYHLELHPVYTNSRFLKGNGVVEGIPAMIPPQYYPFIPPVVHNRRRRSIDGGLDTTEQKTKRSKDDDVAKKSTLENNKLSVFDAQSQDEKRVNVRQSSGLFGLDPSNMYTYYQQQTPTQSNLAEYDTNSMKDASQQARANSEAETEEQILRRKEGNPVKITFPQVNMENLQHAMLLQRSASQSEQQQQVEQNGEELAADTKSTSDSDESSATSLSARTKNHAHQHIKLSDGTKVKVKSPHHQSSDITINYPYNNNQYYPNQPVQIARTPVYQTAAYQAPIYSTSYTVPYVYYITPQTYSPLVYRFYWGNQYSQPLIYYI
ncbi:uncharacterized protein LOC113464469 isoform X2 [Ceratina calcarata]|uniref:Uncharacterized protein LOC113464469 isoform X2 n=1 Tax=Ceratina calcarata TaxID=156304 RepID=A0AAJ7WBI6_9HYME|nr:uncharacterized protein LOC113464469 isoform X2 [Ceratina calcarata]